MKNIRKLSFVCLVSCFVFASVVYAQNAFFNTLGGKMITGIAADGRSEDFTFSRNGQQVVLKRGSRQHKFIKFIGDIAIYEGSFRGSPHYDAFLIVDSKTVSVAGPLSFGAIESDDNAAKFNTPEKAAELLKTKAIQFNIK